MGLTFWWGEKQAWVPTLVSESDLYIPLCRWACLFCSYVWHLTQYLHSSLCPFPFSLFCCLTGIDFKVKTIEVDGKKVKLQVWSVVTVAPSLCFRFWVELRGRVFLSYFPLPHFAVLKEESPSSNHQCHDSWFGESWLMIWWCSLSESTCVTIHIAFLKWITMFQDWLLVILLNLYFLFWSCSISCKIESVFLLSSKIFLTNY